MKSKINTNAIITILCFVGISVIVIVGDLTRAEVDSTAVECKTDTIYIEKIVVDTVYMDTIYLPVWDAMHDPHD